MASWLRNVWNELCLKSICKSFEHIGLVPTDVSPPNTAYPGTPLVYTNQLDSDEDIVDNELYIN